MPTISECDARIEGSQVQVHKGFRAGGSKECVGDELGPTLREVYRATADVRGMGLKATFLRIAREHTYG